MAEDVIVFLEVERQIYINIFVEDGEEEYIYGY